MHDHRVPLVRLDERAWELAVHSIERAFVPVRRWGELHTLHLHVPPVTALSHVISNDVQYGEKVPHLLQCPPVFPRCLLSARTLLSDLQERP